MLQQLYPEARFNLEDPISAILHYKKTRGCAGRAGQRRSTEGTKGHFALLSSAIFKRERFPLRTVHIARTIVW